MRYLVAFLLALLCVPVMADMGSDGGSLQGSSSSAAIMPQPTVSIAEVTPKGRNLTAMIENSHPWDGNSPELLPGEEWVTPDYDLDEVTMTWKAGTYKAGDYTGYLEKGKPVIAKKVACTEAYDEYVLKRGLCGNPAHKKYFRKHKVQPKTVVLQSSSSTLTEKTEYRERKEGPALLSFAKSPLVPDTMPTTTYGPQIEGRVGAWGFNFNPDNPTCGKYPDDGPIPEPDVPYP